MATNEWIIHAGAAVVQFGTCRMKAEAETNDNEPNFSGQREHKMRTYPCPIPCLGKSALCIQPSLLGPHHAPCLPDPEPFSFRLRWQQIHTVWPSFTNFSIVCCLGRTPKCHCLSQQYGNSLSWHMIKRGIISFLLAGGNPEKYHSGFVSVYNRSSATVGSSYRRGKRGLSAGF